MKNIVSQNDLIAIIDGEPVTTSLALAEGTGNQHKNVMELIRNYIDDLQQFGRVAFETLPFETAGGIQKREIAKLNEPQCTLIMTYMKNTEIVRKFKMTLVKAFFEARELLRNQTQQLSLPNFNNPAIAARAWAEQYERAETETLRADEAEATKAHISRHREAVAMGRLGAATKENNRLKEQLGIAETYKQVKAISWLKDYFKTNKSGAWSQIGKALSVIERHNDVAPKYIEDQRYGKVKVYPQFVIQIFKDKLDSEKNYLAKYRKVGVSA